MFCRQCGTGLEAGSLFCPTCGAKADARSSDADAMRGKATPLLGMEKGFFESLFDFSFTSLVTTKLIKVLYGLSIALLALGSLFYIIMSFGISEVAGVFTLLIWAPLFFVLGVCYTRVLLEIIIVVFRIHEHTSEIAQQARINKETPAAVKNETAHTSDKEVR